MFQISRSSIPICTFFENYNKEIFESHFLAWKPFSRLKAIFIADPLIDPCSPREWNVKPSGETNNDPGAINVPIEEQSLIFELT